MADIHDLLSVDLSSAIDMSEDGLLDRHREAQKRVNAAKAELREINDHIAILKNRILYTLYTKDDVLPDEKKKIGSNQKGRDILESIYLDSHPEWNAALENQEAAQRKYEDEVARLESVQEEIRMIGKKMNLIASSLFYCGVTGSDVLNWFRLTQGEQF